MDNSQSLQEIKYNDDGNDANLYKVNLHSDGNLVLHELYNIYLGRGTKDTLLAELQKRKIQNLKHNRPHKEFSFALYIKCHKVTYQATLEDGLCCL